MSNFIEYKAMWCNYVSMHQYRINYVCKGGPRYQTVREEILWSSATGNYRVQTTQIIKFNFDYTSLFKTIFSNGIQLMHCKNTHAKCIKLLYGPMNPSQYIRANISQRIRIRFCRTLYYIYCVDYISTFTELIRVIHLPIYFRVVQMALKHSNISRLFVISLGNVRINRD